MKPSLISLSFLKDGTAMITKEQALTENYFVDDYGRIWRRNGKTRTWKTRPNDFYLPVKHGLWDYGSIVHYARGKPVKNATMSRNTGEESGLYIPVEGRMIDVFVNYLTFSSQ
jgi:hypothetical protein